MISITVKCRPTSRKSHVTLKKQKQFTILLTYYLEHGVRLVVYFKFTLIRRNIFGVRLIIYNIYF